MNKINLLLIILALTTNASAAVMDHSHNGHNGHATGAPIGIMGDHLHPEGDWMVSYRFMRMDMAGSLKDSDSISTADIVSPTGENFMVAPTAMTMDMHMLGLMYAPTDNLTLMGMLPYLDNSMDHITRMGGAFSTASEGAGDLKLIALYGLHTWENQHLHLNIGLSAPTGSIDETDNTPMGTVRLPYPMQLGSGTWDLIAGLTYGGRNPDWAWGSQLMTTIRMQSANDNNYRLGNQMQLSGWLMRTLSQRWQASLRLTGYSWGNIHGADPQLNPNMVPTANPDLRAGKRIDLVAGVNYSSDNAVLQGHTFGIEAGVPAWQDLDGPQLETDLTITAGWQYSFQ